MFQKIKSKFNLYKEAFKLLKYDESTVSNSDVNIKKIDSNIKVLKRRKIAPKEIAGDFSINGRWTGERGSSLWRPNPEKVPEKLNHINRKWKEILDEFNIEGIYFNNYEADFSVVAKSTIEIDNFTENRAENFKKADEIEANKTFKKPSEIKKWREINDYTWHERGDCKTMDLVPAIIHNNIPHSGGIAKIKSLE